MHWQILMSLHLMVIVSYHWFIHNLSTITYIWIYSLWGQSLCWRCFCYRFSSLSRKLCVGNSNSRRSNPRLYNDSRDIRRSSTVYECKPIKYKELNILVIFCFDQIYDGVEEDSEILLAKNQKVLELSRKDSPAAIYTSGSTAMLRFKQTTTTKFQLKIQKVIII